MNMEKAPGAKVESLSQNEPTDEEFWEPILTTNHHLQYYT
jgi:hypothetical protein